MSNHRKTTKPTIEPQVETFTPHYQTPIFDMLALSMRNAGFRVEASGHTGAGQNDGGGILWADFVPGEAPDQNDEGERRRQAWHHKMLAHPAGPLRTLIAPSDVMIARVEQLRSSAPHFASVIDWIIRAMRLAMATVTPLTLPPCLLVGPPGIGKTWFLRQLSDALGIPSLPLAMNVMSDRGSTLTGLSPAWKSSGPGKIAKLLIEGSCASPLVLLDEIDKISPLNPAETPVECLHTLLEPENARAFVDEFIDVEIDASRILWFASANDASKLPSSIRDRFITFTIEIDERQQLLIARDIFANANAAFRFRFSLATQDLLESVLDLTPRRASRLWPLAFGFAAEAQRDFVTSGDIRKASKLVDDQAKTQPIGFIDRRPSMH